MRKLRQSRPICESATNARGGNLLVIVRSSWVALFAGCGFVGLASCGGLVDEDVQHNFQVDAAGYVRCATPELTPEEIQAIDDEVEAFTKSVDVVIDENGIGVRRD